MEQKRMFGDLKKLLMCKLQANTENESMSKGQKLGNNVNVLQLWWIETIDIVILMQFIESRGMMVFIINK